MAFAQFYFGGYGAKFVRTVVEQRISGGSELMAGARFYWGEKICG